jgi:hypothetical protein
MLFFPSQTLQSILIFYSSISSPPNNTINPPHLNTGLPPREADMPVFPSPSPERLADEQEPLRVPRQPLPQATSPASAIQELSTDTATELFPPSPASLVDQPLLIGNVVHSPQTDEVPPSSEKAGSTEFQDSSSSLLHQPALTPTIPIPSHLSEHGPDSLKKRASSKFNGPLAPLGYPPASNPLIMRRLTD